MPREVHTVRNVQTLGCPYEAVSPFIFAVFHDIEYKPKQLLGNLPFCGIVCVDEHLEQPGGAEVGTAKIWSQQFEDGEEQTVLENGGGQQGEQQQNERLDASNTKGGREGGSRANNKKSSGKSSGGSRTSTTASASTSSRTAATKQHSSLPIRRGQTPGFPQHPHQGCEMITWVLQGHIDHSDNLGNLARIGQGDAQWIMAGRRYWHAEMFPLLQQNPLKQNRLRVLQLWLEIPGADRLESLPPPAYAVHWAERIPCYDSDRVRVRVLVGSWDSAHAEAFFAGDAELPGNGIGTKGNESGSGRLDAATSQISASLSAKNAAKRSSSSLEAPEQITPATGGTKATLATFLAMDHPRLKQAGEQPGLFPKIQLTGVASPSPHSSYATSTAGPASRGQQDSGVGVYLIELFWKGAECIIPPVVLHSPGSGGSAHDVRRTLYFVEGSALAVDFDRLVIRKRHVQMDVSPVQPCHVKNMGEDPVMLLVLQGRPIGPITGRGASGGEVNLANRNHYAANAAAIQYGPFVMQRKEDVVRAVRESFQFDEPNVNDFQHPLLQKHKGGFPAWPFESPEPTLGREKPRCWRINCKKNGECDHEITPPIPMTQKV